MLLHREHSSRVITKCQCVSKPQVQEETVQVLTLWAPTKHSWKIFVCKELFFFFFSFSVWDLKCKHDALCCCYSGRKTRRAGPGGCPGCGSKAWLPVLAASWLMLQQNTPNLDTHEFNWGDTVPPTGSPWLLWSPPQSPHTRKLCNSCRYCFSASGTSSSLLLRLKPDIQCYAS